MKKLLCLMLALLMCASLMVACGGDDDDTPAVDDLAPFTAALTASAPKSAKITTVLTTELGALNAEYNVTYGEDGSVSITFTREKFNEITDTTTEFKSTVEGTAAIDAAGNLSGDLGAGAVSSAAAVNLTLSADKMTYTVDGGVLNATVTAANTQAVLGVAINADVTVKLTVANGKVSSLILTYTTTEGPAEIVAVYTN